MMIAAGMDRAMMTETIQPLPVIILPIFLSLPPLVSGMPIDREILDLTPEIPINRFHENPPLFMAFL